MLILISKESLRNRIMILFITKKRESNKSRFVRVMVDESHKIRSLSSHEICRTASLNIVDFASLVMDWALCWSFQVHRSLNKPLRQCTSYEKDHLVESVPISTNSRNSGVILEINEQIPPSPQQLSVIWEDFSLHPIAWSLLIPVGQRLPPLRLVSRVPPLQHTSIWFLLHD